jgi:hypothetical protein
VSQQPIAPRMPTTIDTWLGVIGVWTRPRVISLDTGR